LSDAQKLRIYDLYFEAMRAGHAGQAIDIDGMEKIVSKAVESGDSAELEKRILACDRLKTAVPVASLARMGAVAGGGTEEQIEALGNYFESLGIAFQIIDDVLDLRGFEKNLKEKGEDIRKRKFTLPLAKALSKLPLEERRWVWKMVQPSPPKQRAVSAVASKLEACGVFDDCIKEASQLVESAWKDVNQKIEDSLFKILLRATSWYLLERKH
jgi:geranylgeranyl pyrophosphate synthase